MYSEEFTRPSSSYYARKNNIKKGFPKNLLLRLLVSFPKC
jgi:hypothetical protein